LDKKYGENAEVKMVWHDDSLKNKPDQWGAAIAYGDLEIHTRWETEESDVVLSCQGEDFEVEMSVVYESKELAPLATDQEEYLEGRARSWAKAAKAKTKPLPSGPDVTKQVEAALLQMEMDVKPPAGEEELKKRYEMVKSESARRGRQVDAEVILAAGAQNWPMEYTPNPPGPKGLIVAADIMRLGTAMAGGGLSQNASSLVGSPQAGSDNSELITKIQGSGELTGDQGEDGGATTFQVANLTLAKVKDNTTMFQVKATQIEVLEGPQKGRVGWVLADWVY